MRGMARSRTHAARMDWRRDSQHQKVGRYCARTSGSEVTSLHQTAVNTGVSHWRVELSTRFRETKCRISVDFVRGTQSLSTSQTSHFKVSETDLCKLVPGLQWSSGTPATLRL